MEQSEPSIGNKIFIGFSFVSPESGLLSAKLKAVVQTWRIDTHSPVDAMPARHHKSPTAHTEDNWKIGLGKGELDLLDVAVILGLSIFPNNEARLLPDFFRPNWE